MLVNETIILKNLFRTLSESSFIESSIFRLGVRVFYCRVRVSQTRVRARVRVFPESGFSSGPSLSPSLEVCRPERVAPAVKRLKTSLRNSLKNDMLESLMHITINGPDVKDSDFASLIQDVVNKWSTEICWKKLAKVKQVDSYKLYATAANNASMHQPLDGTTLLDDYEMQKNQFEDITPRTMITCKTKLI